jgi:hypothetical protein
VPGYFNDLTAVAFPAPSAFSCKKHAGAMISPTAKSLKKRSRSVNPPAMQGAIGQVPLHGEEHSLNTYVFSIREVFIPWILIIFNALPTYPMLRNATQNDQWEPNFNEKQYGCRPTNRHKGCQI